ncbi:MAG TPA: hypothetical protein VNT01_01280 [Symbiobacteriaceae bacterium]|nr:hypothetical protein [Symbiobacteriaceae bacterium]
MGDIVIPGARTFDQVLADLLTPLYPKLDCAYDGIMIDFHGRLSRDLIDYCYRHGLVRQSNGKAWSHFASIKAPDGTPVIKVWWGRQYPRMANVRIRVNPSTGGISAGQFVAVLALLVGSYDALEKMLVAGADCKLDIEGISPAGLDRYLMAAHARKRRTVFGMVVIGSRRGTSQLVMYDLGAKLGQPKGQVSRLEYRQRFKTNRQRERERPLLWDWLEQADHLDNNLFDRLALANPDLLDRRTREARLVAAYGTTQAYLSLPPEARRRFKRRVVDPSPEGSLADAFSWEAEQWHETLDLAQYWLPRAWPFVK